MIRTMVTTGPRSARGQVHRTARLVVIALAFLATASVHVGPEVRGDDWPFWLGLKHDGTFAETGWLKNWPADGPPRLFEIPAGLGYSSAAVADGNLLFFHRIGNFLHVDNLNPLTGDQKWRYSYPTDYIDRYRYSSGPRCCPVIDLSSTPRRVFTLGPKGVLIALDLASGEKLWERDLQGEHKFRPNFFGVGAAPLLDGDR